MQNSEYRKKMLNRFDYLRIKTFLRRKAIAEVNRYPTMKVKVFVTYILDKKFISIIYNI